MDDFDFPNILNNYLFLFGYSRRGYNEFYSERETIYVCTSVDRVEEKWDLSRVELPDGLSDTCLSLPYRWGCSVVNFRGTVQN